MACPLFLPSVRLGGTPLFEGRCAADPNSEVSFNTLRDCCNPGYARGRCDNASGAEADVFRFLVRSRVYGRVEVAWSAERDHHPVAVGTLLLTGCVPANAEPLHVQASVYAARVESVA